MSDKPVTYELRDDVAILTFDDGKANVISSDNQSALNGALDRAEKEAKAVVITGRPGRFSAGFDLKVMSDGDAQAMVKMVRGGAELAIRLFSFPLPVVIAVSGHALAMGAVLLLTADERISGDAPAKIGLNETQIGMSLPLFALQLARERLNPAHLSRATVNAEIYSPEGAVEAGYLDRVVPNDRLLEAALARARALASLDLKAFHASKLALRQGVIHALRESLGEFPG